jgi:hypothetical protein
MPRGRQCRGGIFVGPRIIIDSLLSTVSGERARAYADLYTRACAVCRSLHEQEVRVRYYTVRHE